jgi:SpoVK/Ycf46/Vps4 family AAA+-type ATPase
MASGELLKKLFKSYKQRDGEGFYAAAMQIVAEEQDKNHNLLARELRGILENGSGRPANGTGLRSWESLPRDRERGSNLLEVRSSERYLADIVLRPEVAEQVRTVLSEYRATSLLSTHGLQPRRRLLFCGPPGCGKTLCAEVMAGELGLPLVYTRFDAVISSFLGETSANLRQVFEFSSRGNWVVFFDEFDAIGKSRDDITEHGELKRVVNTFLQLLDSFHADSILIAATNHEGLLDNALWRRFDDIIYFDLPPETQIPDLIQMKLRGFHHTTLNPEAWVQQLSGWSHADIERVCLESMKMALLSGRSIIDDDLFQQAVERQVLRIKAIKGTQR